MRKANYDKSPYVAVPEGEAACVEGWAAIAGRLKQALARANRQQLTLVVECYPGVDEAQVLAELTARLAPVLAVHAAQAMLPPERIDRLVAPFLGGDDPVFGFLSGLNLPQFFDPQKLCAMRESVEGVPEGLVLIVGCGARLIAEWRYSGLCRPRALGGAESFSPQRGQQSRRREPDPGGRAAIQARLLRGLARVPTAGNGRSSRMGFRPRHQRPARAEAGRGRGRAARACARRPAGHSASCPSSIRRPGAASG